MIMPVFRSYAAVALLALCCAAAPASAQDTPGRPLAAEAISQDVRLLFSLAALFNPAQFGGVTTGWYEHDGYTYQYFVDSNTYAGVRNGEVFVLGGMYGKRVVPVGTLGNVLALLMEKTRANVIETSRTQVEFEYLSGASSLPAAQTFTLESLLPTGWTLIPGASWFSVSHTSGTTGDGSQVRVSINANALGLAPGKHMALLLVRNESDQYLSLHLPVTLWKAASGVAVTASTPDVLDFDVTHMVNDTRHGKLYFSDQYSKRVYQVDAASGHTLRYFQFTRIPDRMAIAPDGKRLYVGLLDRPHSAYWWDEEQTGGIGVIDLDAVTLLGQFDVDLDPYELAATSDGRLFVGGGSGQWTSVNAYDVASGGKTGEIQSVYQGTRIFLHPSQDWLYASQSDIAKYEVPAAGAITRTAWTYSAGAAAWITPNGRHLYTTGGDILLASSLLPVTKIVNETIVDLAFDVPTNTVVILTHTDKLQRYGMGDYRFLLTAGTGLVDPRYVEIAAGDVIVVDFVTGEYVLKRF